MKHAFQQSAFCIKRRNPEFQRAFSLYDALVALTVVSTVATVAVPSFQQLTFSQRMTGAVNSMVTALHLARSEAINRRARAILCPSVDGRVCHNGGSGSTVWEEGYLLYIDHNGNHVFDADDMAVWVFAATTGLLIRSSPSRNHVTYQPNGLASGSNLSITFCDKHDRGAPRAVIVSSGGRPRVSTRNSGGGVIRCNAAS